MNRHHQLTASVLFTSLCLAALPALAQDKTKSEPSGQEKIAPIPGKDGAKMTGKDTSSMPGHPAMGMMHDSKMVDSNGDGMISKAEFTKHHETMWANMKKNAKGQVSVSDMGMMGK